MCNNFWQLTAFEIRKSLFRKGSIITIIIGFILIVVSPFGTILGNYYDSEGNVSNTRYDEMCTEREYSRALSGRVIDADLIMEASAAYSKIPSEYSERSYTDTEEYNLYARPYSEIYGFVHRVYDMDYSEFGKITHEQAENFYNDLQSYIEVNINSLPMSAKAKQKVISDFESINKPFVYEYTGGYQRMAVISYTSGLVAAIVAAIVFASIFSGEYTSGMDSVVLTSRNGKGTLIASKIIASLSFTALFTAVTLIVTYVECMLCWGSDGGDSAVQLFVNFTVYPLYTRQTIVIYCISILTACIFSTALTAVFSAKFKNPFSAIIVMMIILIIPMMLNIEESAGVLYLLYSILPTNVMAYWCGISELQYEIFGAIIPPYVFLPICEVVLTAVILPFVYIIFRRHQVK